MAKKIDENNKNVTINDLAIMVAEGFANTATKDDIKRFDQRMDGFDQKMDRFDQRMDHTDARLAMIEQDVHELRKNAISPHEFNDALVRVKYVERKLGIESGK